MLKTELTYDLLQPVVYDFQGVQKEATQLTLRAPNRSQLKFTAPLKQGFMRAMKSLQGERTEAKAVQAAEAESNIGADEVLAVLLMSDVDFYDYAQNFMKLACSGAVLLDGTTPMTSVLYDRLSDDDGDKILGLYVANFMLASLTKN